MGIKTVINLRGEATHARYLFELGLVERARGRDELAERAWRRVLAATPHHDGALGELALLLGRTGRLEEALELADQASSRPDSQPELGEQADELATKLIFKDAYASLITSEGVAQAEADEAARESED